MKNLVLFHMESLNRINYEMNKEYFKNISGIQKDSLYFTNYFSTATSTFMVMSDLLWQNMRQFEQTCDVKALINGWYRKESVFDVFDKKGYDILVANYPPLYKDEINYCNLLGRNIKTKYYERHAKMIGDVENIVKGDNPFVVYVVDNTGHLYYSDAKKDESNNTLEYWKKGFENIDTTFGKIVDVLKKNDKLENTIIVAYGDHGDDFWGHSLNGGLCHGNEPFTNIINTPLFIYNADIEGKVIDDITQTTDIMDIVIDMLEKGNKEKINREYVFSRNLYANQTFNHKLLNKSYSVANRDYNLIVSKKGLEMYAYHMDFTNQYNLLELFKMDKNGEVTPIEMYDMHVHYRKFFTEKQILDIQKNLRELRDILMSEIKELYRGIKLDGNECRVRMNYFNKINYRKHSEYIFENRKKKVLKKVGR